MTLKEELAHDLEITRQDFHHLLDSVPEAFYAHPSDNPAWTIGDVLHHITLGPAALRFEIWMIRHAPLLFQLGLNSFTARLFNKVNARFARRKSHSRSSLKNVYEYGHAGIRSSLMRMREEDFQKSVMYPVELVSELAGNVTIERLFRYVKDHFDVHAEQIRAAIEEQQQK